MPCNPAAGTAALIESNRICCPSLAPGKAPIVGPQPAHLSVCALVRLGIRCHFLGSRVLGRGSFPAPSLWSCPRPDPHQIKPLKHQLPSCFLLPRAPIVRLTEMPSSTSPASTVNCALENTTSTSQSQSSGPRTVRQAPGKQDTHAIPGNQAWLSLKAAVLLRSSAFRFDTVLIINSPFSHRPSPQFLGPPVSAPAPSFPDESQCPMLYSKILVFSPSARGFQQGDPSPYSDPS